MNDTPHSHLTFSLCSHNKMYNRSRFYIYVHYWLVIIPMTMKLCLRGMPTKTFNIHELQVCKQQQIASGNKTCKLMFMPITWLC